MNNLKQLLWLVWPLYMMGCIARTDQPFDRFHVESEVDLLLEKQVQAWNAGDIPGFMDGYWKSDSLRFVSRKSVLHGHASLGDMYRKSYPDRESMGRLEFAVQGKKWMGDSVLNVLGRWKVQQSDTAYSGNFCLFFMPVEEGWRIVEDHTW